jgi:hypothetical protein
VEFVLDKVALGQVFSEYFCFPCQSSFHQLLYSHHHLSSGAGTIGQTVAAVPSGLNLTPLIIIIKKYSKLANPEYLGGDIIRINETKNLNTNKWRI